MPFSRDFMLRLVDVVLKRENIKTCHENKEHNFYFFIDFFNIDECTSTSAT